MKGTKVELLPRGGALVETSAGVLQFGAVPETIKDTMGRDAGVPRIFVIPARLFAVERGLSFADLEFPIYFNFFALRRKIVVICDARQKRLLAGVLREAIFGPRQVSLEADLPAGAAPVAIPDLAAEFAFFRKHPHRPGTEMTLDDMVSFVTFDREGRARLDDVTVERDPLGAYRVLDGETVVGEISADWRLPPRPQVVLMEREPFVPPIFGLTFIGTGHGFDPTSKTSGFILWVKGRGILVDPPVDSTEWLREHGINPKLVDSLILTHCHADHDSGTLQKVLEEGRVKVYTTRTILQSFQRKYRGLIGIDKKRFEGLFDFVPVTVGEPIPIGGGEFWFHYTLHSVPAIGFELYLGGKSLVYTSDTLHDPAIIDQMHEEGILSEARRQELLNFPWHHDLIIHEAGIPPIHTPASFLEELPDDVKRRMLLVHTQQQHLPAGTLLRVAPTGLERTVILEAQEGPVSEAIAQLEVLSRVDLFRDFPLHKAGEFLGMVERLSYRAGERIITRDTKGDRFYMIQQGSAVVRDGTGDSKVYGPYDYFGETAIILDTLRSADVYALTDVVLLALERHDFLYFLRGSAIAQNLRQLARMRRLDTWELLDGSDAFGPMTPTQLTQLQGIMDDEPLAAGTYLSYEGHPQRNCFVVAEGVLEVSRAGELVGTLGRGGFVGEVRLLYGHGKQTFSYRARTDAIVYRLPRRALVDYLKKNPGLYVRLTAYQRG